MITVKETVKNKGLHQKASDPHIGQSQKGRKSAVIRFAAAKQTKIRKSIGKQFICQGKFFSAISPQTEKGIVKQLSWQIQTHTSAKIKLNVRKICGDENSLVGFLSKVKEVFLLLLGQCGKRGEKPAAGNGGRKNAAGGKRRLK